MLDLVKPSVGVVTLVALEHYTAFRSLESVAEEKRKLVESLPRTGLAVLNYDDPRVASMASCTRARVTTFGVSGGDYQVQPTQSSIPGALVVPILHNNKTFKIKTRLTGSHNGLLVGAVFACAHQLGVPVQTIAERFASFEPLFGRCSVHAIDNGPVFIADTCKSPYHSIYLPINMMAEFDAPRRRIIVGQISDYPGNPWPKYRDVYRACRRVADQVLFVGENAHRSKAPPEDISTGRFVEKRSVEEAADFVKRTAIAGETILLKSSQRLHLERILLNFAQQARCWEQNCGRSESCGKCGFVDVPFSDQKEIRKARQALQRLQPSRWEAALVKALPSAFLP
jgi:UDP-N-acetylmuramoyl-tripeptide--D-alanyl-D-alanine ligase